MKNILRHTCYVSIPFGKKNDPATGRTIDFDQIYSTVIRPAVEEAGLECLRADELRSSGILQRAVIEAVLRSDVMIADLSTTNADVFYELGLRHAVRRSRTIIIGSNESRLPFNVSYLRVLLYQVGDAGVLDAENSDLLRSQLRELLGPGFERTVVDSPVFQFYPDLLVRMPFESAADQTTQFRTISQDEEDEREKFDSLLGRLRAAMELKSQEERIEALRRIEPEILAADDPSATLQIELLRSYRDSSSWQNMIRLFESFPMKIQQMPVVVQQTALALNRMGDRDRALSMLNDLVNQKGGDSETYGLLGRIYKDRFAESNEEKDLDQAIDAYRKGFEADKSDYYPGVNLVTLLNTKGDKASRDEMHQVLPVLRDIIDQRMSEGPSGYWEIATGLELAALARDWSSAKRYAAEARSRAAAPWMIESTSRNLQLIADNLEMTESREELQSVIGKLARPSERGGTL